MKKTIKNLIFITSMLATSSIFALDKESVLSEDANTVVNHASEYLNLELNLDSKIKLYNYIFKDYVTNGEWNLYPLAYNDALNNSKSKKSPVKFVDYVLSYKNRTVYINIIN